MIPGRGMAKKERRAAIFSRMPFLHRVCQIKKAPPDRNATAITCY